MMKVSTRGRYALRLMIDLAQHRDEGYISLKEISGQAGRLPYVIWNRLSPSF